jgi:glycine hydroxymethyltransferase
MKFLEKFFSLVPEEKRSPSAVAYVAALDAVSASFPQIGKAIIQELVDQRCCLKLIASENYSSLAVQLAMGNLLTDKYAEGSLFHRYYSGCENVDIVESAAVEEVKKLFSCEHAYVQPHSGADANMVAFWSILVHRVQNKELERLSKKNIDDLSVEEYEKVRQLLLNQKMMGMTLNSGGHLTHGYRQNFSSKMMQAIGYDVDPVTGLIDYSQLQMEVKKERPAILVAGYSSYSRLINFRKMREIADTVGATLLVDMAHFAGLVAGKVMTGEYNPVPFAHMITSTTHKTLRGPRGGFILCTKEYQPLVDRGCPIVLGGPLPHVMAAKAVAFKEANSAEFQAYAQQVVINCRALAEEFLALGASLITGGTDNHLLTINVNKGFGITGMQAETLLRNAQITVNRNAIPFDTKSPWFGSGIRLGTAALTTRGMKEGEMKVIAKWVVDLLSHAKPLKEENNISSTKAVVDPKVLKAVQENVGGLVEQFPLYPEIVID